MQAIGGSRPVKACGFTFGVERLVTLMPENEQSPASPTRAIIIPISPQDMPYALQVARAARMHGAHVELDISRHGLSAALKLAVKKSISFALIVGESEAREQHVTLRNLNSGAEQSYDKETAIRYLQAQEVAR
jgi:histidyl-tRNA synthetase